MGIVAEAREQSNGSVVEAYWKHQVSKSYGSLRYCGDLEYLKRKSVIAMSLADLPSSGIGGGGGGGLN